MSNISLIKVLLFLFVNDNNNNNSDSLYLSSYLINSLLSYINNTLYFAVSLRVEQYV